MNARILSLGAGVQSSVVKLLAMRGEIAPIDYSIMADTQEEPEGVYATIWWLASLGGGTFLVDSKGRLGDHLLHGMGPKRRFASIPAFTSNVEGGVSRYNGNGVSLRQCTREYKIEVVERVIRRTILGLQPGERVPKSAKITQVFGISADEARRAVSIQKRIAGTPWQAPSFPLLDLGWTRTDCKRWLDTEYPGHPVVRSACEFCPYKSNYEWRRLKEENGKGWARAVEIDNGLRQPGAAAARGLRHKLYLHSSCKPLAEADFNEAQMQLGFATECIGMCGV